jgi:adenine-specific DNA-methyltransferase
VIKYLGSKRLLVPAIVRAVTEGGASSALDLFAGTSRVGHALKRAGLRVHANDHNAYAFTIARCYVAADARRWREPAERLLPELERVPASPGWFTDTYCVRSRYLKPENGARVEAIRNRIATLALEPELEAIALTSLVEAADRVDSTVGVQMAYLKQWAARAHQPLRLRLPELLDGPGSASCLDAAEAAGAHTVDVAYLDPPYNQHSYLGNYHLWETLVRWDAPEVYGIACKRIDVRERGSAFNRRGLIADAFAAVLARVRARRIVVSFSDEGYLALPELRDLLATRGVVSELSVDHPRYIGHRLGVYNPQGEKVGTPGPARNREHLFVVECNAARVRRAAPLAGAAHQRNGRRPKAPAARVQRVG